MIDIAYHGTDVNECASQNGGYKQICTNTNGVSSILVILDLVVTFSVQVKEAQYIEYY